MSDQLNVLKLVAARLDALSVPYMITGSLASSHYATPRFTRDIDIVVELDRPAAERLAKSPASEFYVDDHALRSAVDRAGMANIIHLQLMVKVDLIVRKDTPYRCFRSSCGCATAVLRFSAATSRPWWRRSATSIARMLIGGRRS